MHKNQLWILDLVETNNKNFHIILVRNRSAETIKTFVTRSIPLEMFWSLMGGMSMTGRMIKI